MAPRRMAALALITALAIVDSVSAMWTEFELRTLVDMNTTESKPVIFGVRPKRVKKGVYGIAGIVTINDAFDGYECEVNVYQSPQGNNVYTQSPIKIPRGPLCSKANEEYRKFIMVDLHVVSDLPFSEDSKEDLCKMFVMKDFELKNFMYDSSSIPKFLQPGMYKVHILIMKNGAVTSGLEAIVNLS